ncbi:DUF6624 domain-containing protein [Epilithonimonas mollis]|uniref:Uncharacterized protein n=1 Tax=Epilithonimonas mollis TaxID=216903 RepID=A0A1M6UPP7_9FLAO|nr:DUF6624 domain-containing protein [Epilithonimonas mollis]SHK71133.1 hypothetical protein SAMN05444371_3401 [Epilithonimonas mollis]
MNEDRTSKKLLQLLENDLAVRARLVNENNLTGVYHPEMEEVHKDNADELRQIIKEIGFPGISKVGKEASEAACLIIQHSIAEPAFMKACYQLMLENESDINKKYLAYLHDCILYFEGMPQRYGTQLNSDGTIYPVIDVEQLNDLRLQYGLTPVSQEDMGHILPTEDIEWLEAQNSGYTQWRNKVGWKSRP